MDCRKYSFTTKLLCLILVVTFAAGFVAMPVVQAQTTPSYTPISEGTVLGIDGQVKNAVDGSQEPGTNGIKRFKLICKSPEVEIDLIQTMQQKTVVAGETEETYAVRSQGSLWGYLVYDSYTFENGDLYYYLKYITMSSQAKDLRLVLPFTFERFDLRAVQYPKGLDLNTSKIELYPNQTTLENALTVITPSSVYIDSEALDAFFSYTSVYERGSYQIRKELFENARGITLSDEGVTVTLPASAKSFSEQWGILTQSNLVDWNNKDTVDKIKIADLGRVRKWGGDGQYYALPRGYSPYSANGFYRNNANHIGDKFILSTGRMFEDYGYITMETLIKTQGPYAYWGTSPISDWLIKDYKIGAGFFDTRWDTEAAFSLLKGYRRFGESRALEAANTFADFYCDYALSHSYKTKSGGILVYDYGFDATPGIKTHVSLNHLVNEMNFLLEMYITTENEVYYKTADRILTGIRDTGTGWINKSSGDLYYAYQVNGRYGMTDYPTLTLNDLRYAQSLIKKVYGKEEAVLTKLIAAKEKYLTAHKIAF